MRIPSTFLLVPLVFASPIDKFKVRDLPGLSDLGEKAPEMHAGHIPVVGGTNYFFWRFHEPNTERDQLIFWLNGGPGCSSMDGALIEVGPLRVSKEGKVVYNEGNWAERSDIVFVDQPGGTGFSSAKSYDEDLNVVADHFVAFMQNYFAEFPEDKEKEILLSGESYAGQYIPFIASKVIENNEAGKDMINLKALLIGNGWIAPDIQSLAYMPFVLDQGIVTKENPEFSALLKAHENCQNLVNQDNGSQFNYADCENILSAILRATRDKSNKEQECLNMYDTRLRDTYPSCGMNWPGDLPQLGFFLQSEDVIKNLNLDPSHVEKWHECDNTVQANLRNTGIKPAYNLLPDILSKMEIVLFNGDKDIICNNYGIEDMISQMTWAGNTGFSEDIETHEWFHEENGDIFQAGIVMYDRNLTFINVFNASHMVAFDNAPVSRGVLDLFNNHLEHYNNGVLTRTEGIEYEEEDDQESEHEEDQEIDDEKDHEIDHDDEASDEHDDEASDEHDDEAEHNSNNDQQDNDDKDRATRDTSNIIYMSFYVVVLAAIGFFGYRMYIRIRQPKPILVDPNTHHATKKTVSWAMDFEEGPGSSTRKEYQSLPVEDFEMESFNDTK